MLTSSRRGDLVNGSKSTVCLDPDTGDINRGCFL